MAIEGLYIRPEVQPTAEFRAGAPDVDEAIGVTIEAHRELGYSPDEDTARESLKADFGAVAGLGYDGRLYIEPPAEVATDDIIAAADGKRPDGVDKTYKYPNLWVPGTEKKSYTQGEIDAAPEEPEARLAVFNADKETGVDDILHFLGEGKGMPYDNKYREAGQTTQLEAFKALQEKLAEKQAQIVAKILGPRAIAMNVLMDRIRGVDPEAKNYVNHRSNDFILNAGWARVPAELRRRKVDGDSLAGVVYSRRGGLGFDHGLGHALGSEGLGVSVGLPQQPKTS